MRFQNFEYYSKCFGGRHRSSTTNVISDRTFIENTGNKKQMFIGLSSKCVRRKSLTASDNTIVTERLSDFF